ncbi:MAG: transcription termination factor Rho [Planctomycetes bacterium]|nr:transcription termination factor Rho [Planctomycetota bacterium]
MPVPTPSRFDALPAAEEAEAPEEEAEEAPAKGRGRGKKAKAEPAPKRGRKARGKAAADDDAAAEEKPKKSAAVSPYAPATPSAPTPREVTKELRGRESARPASVAAAPAPAVPTFAAFEAAQPAPLPTLKEIPASLIRNGSLSITQLERTALPDLLQIAEKEGLEDLNASAKTAVVGAIVRKRLQKHGIMLVEGCLEILPEGFGFLRPQHADYLPGTDDVFVSQAAIKKYGLKTGHMIHASVRPPRESEKYLALARVDRVNGVDPEALVGKPAFEELTPLYPHKRLVLETERDVLETRILDLVAPIGKGQRGLIVSPPRAGKTVLLQKIAQGITTNNPECHLIVLLVDERPEEVTDMERSIKGEVIASTFDEPASRHVQVAQMVIQKAKRMVEFGLDVVILLDSITRLARAYNTTAPNSGKILSGGIDAGALQKPKQFFGAARNIEEGGSLTILGTALVDTGSRMDEVIFEEFKGTGNMEIVLDRRLADRRIFPAVDVNASGTRREDLLLSADELERVWTLRRFMNDIVDPVEAMELLVEKMRKTGSNAEFLLSMNVDS